jgi:hypothetical protein
MSEVEVRWERQRKVAYKTWVWRPDNSPSFYKVVELQPKIWEASYNCLRLLEADTYLSYVLYRGNSKKDVQFHVKLDYLKKLRNRQQKINHND